MVKPKILCLVGSVIQFIGVGFAMFFFQYVWNRTYTYSQLITSASRFGNPILYPLLFSIGVILSSISLMGTKKPLMIVGAIMSIFSALTFLIVWITLAHYSPAFRVFCLIWIVTDIFLFIGSINIREYSKIPLVFFLIVVGLSIPVFFIFGFMFLANSNAFPNPLITISNPSDTIAEYLDVYLYLLSAYSAVKSLAFLTASFVNPAEKRFKIVKEAEDTLSTSFESDFDSFVGSNDGFDTEASVKKVKKEKKKGKKKEAEADEWGDF